MIELADVSMNTTYRMYETGSISAKLAVAIGQVVNVNPYYLIGSIDEPGYCTDDIIAGLFKEYKYDKLLAAHKRMKKKEAQEPEPEQKVRLIKKNKTAAPAAPVKKEPMADVKDKQEYSEAPAPASKEKVKCEAVNENSILKMPDEDVMLLIRSLKLKAGIGVCSAVKAIKDLDNVLLT